MAKKTLTSAPTERFGGNVHIENWLRADGREAWRITSGGKVVNLTTSNSSTVAINEAVRIYGPALKRLADK
jgi:hypothetical protein